MYKPIHAIEARIWGETVGAEALDHKLGYYAFRIEGGGYLYADKT